MKALMKKLTSRKFLAAMAGVVSGIVVVASGSTTEGITAIITSVVAYLIAEGYIDAKAIKTAAEVAQEVETNIENK